MKIKSSYYLPELKQTDIFCMVSKETHEIIGNVGYNVTGRTPEGKTVHLGYFSYPKFWGGGYMAFLSDVIVDENYRGLIT